MTTKAKQNPLDQYVLIDIDKLVKADWNYKQDDEVKTAKLRANIRRNGQVENIIVRDCDNLQYHAVVPSAFSPNGDGENDMLFVRGEGIKTLEFVIYTRWGEKVFETTSKDNGWNGIYKGKPMDPAVYVYSLKVTFDDNTELQHTGDVTLVR